MKYFITKSLSNILLFIPLQVRLYSQNLYVINSQIKSYKDMRNILKKKQKKKNYININFDHIILLLICFITIVIAY